MNLVLKHRRYDAIDQQILDYIREHKTAHGGQAPTIRQIAAHIEFASLSATNYRLDKLEKYGYIKRGDGARAITLCDEQPAALPLLVTYASAVYVQMPEELPMLKVASVKLERGKRYRVTISEVTE